MFDLFICHASEDKDAVVRPLAKRLSDAGLSIWYDEFSLRLGDSLRQSVDRGLRDSRYGVVVLSPRFFEKDWPQAELDGLFAKEIGGSNTILPVWHEVDRADVLKRSPMLADRVATKTVDGLDRVIEQILDVVEPDLSHRTREGLTVSVTPMSIRLHAGDWSVKTPVLVSNRSNSALYTVGLKITIQTVGIESGSVRIQPDAKATALQGLIGPISVSPDLIRLDCLDSESHETVALFFHTIEAKKSREFVISGTSPIASTAQVRVWSFNTEPAEILEKPGKIALPFSVPESVQLKGIQIALKRK
jgi:hypothetical protein